jgi:hypothetical protein
MYKAYAIGTPKPLPPGALGEPGSKRSTERRLRGSAGGEEGLLASWRYYVSRAEELLGHRPDSDDDD